MTVQLLTEEEKSRESIPSTASKNKEGGKDGDKVQHCGTGTVLGACEGSVFVSEEKEKEKRNSRVKLGEGGSKKEKTYRIGKLKGKPG